MNDFLFLLPEVFLAATLAGIIFGEIGSRGESLRLAGASALMGLAGAFIQTILTYERGAAQVVANTVSIDGLSLFFKLFFITLSALAIISAMNTREILKSQRSEYCALIVGTCLAMSIAAAASDLLLAFLALQAMNVFCYLLAAYSKRSVLSTEAAVKHLAFGVVSAGLFLFGIAILFASTKTINLYEMHKVLVANPLPREAALVVFMLVFLSLCFQFAAFPMSLWAPDVLEGAPTPVSAFLSIGPRAAGFAVALRFVLVLFSQASLEPGQWQIVGDLDWTRIVAFLSGATMITGSLLAFRQEGAKRLVAYLVVAETGFLLMGLLVLDQVGVAALLYNLVVQLFALMGAFYVLAFLFDVLQSDRLRDLRGMLGRAVPESIALILFLCCLVGVPPLPGFIGKFTLVGAAIRHQWYPLALIAIISGTISSVAVGRLAYSLIGDIRQPTMGEPVDHNTSRRVFLAAVFLPMMLVGIFAEPVLSWAGQSLQFILW